MCVARRVTPRAVDEDDTATTAPTSGGREHEDLLIHRVLGHTPEQRLRGLARAAAFFASARRI